MKKRAVFLTVLLIASLLSVPLTARALPSVMSGVVAYDFNDITTVTYGKEDANMYCDKIDSSTVRFTGSVEDFGGGNKGVRLESTSTGYSGAVIIRNCYGGSAQTDQWPTTETPIGVFFRIKNDGEEFAFRFAINLDVKAGVFKKISDGSPLAGGTSFRCFQGNDTEGFSLIKLDGTIIPYKYFMDSTGATAVVNIPAGFDGYFVYEFDTFQLEGLKNTYDYADGSAIDYYNIPASAMQWWNSYFRWSFYLDNGIPANVSFVLDDYGYLTENIATPTATPTATATATTTSENTSTPTSENTSTPTPGQQTDEPSQQTTDPGPDTGAISIAGFAAAAIVSGSAVVISKKKR